MKVLLIDVDSTIPNLALMKISAYHKSKGDEVGFNITDPDIIYASVIFKKNRHLVDGLPLFYPNAKIDIGGSGYDLHKVLSPEIEACIPDYNLYPDCDRFYGFTTRGCIRNCPFCIVPKKEGKFRTLYWSPYDAIHDITSATHTRFDKIEFMDNNILANRRWFIKLCRYLIVCNNWEIDFNQGLDIRLMDDYCAKLLSQLRPITCWKFAFDNMNYADKVKKGIDILNRNGVKVRQNCMFYVYVDKDEDFQDALDRCNLLKEWGATPYIMLNMDVQHTKRMKDLKRWCRPWVFWSSNYDEYKVGVKA